MRVRSIRRAPHASSWAVYAALLALVSVLADIAPVCAADPAAAHPLIQAPHKSPQRDPAAAFAKRLNLDAKQQAQVRRLLAIQQAQIRNVWSDPSIDGDDRVGAVKAISAKTVEQIRSLLTEEQKQKYFQPRPSGSLPAEPSRSVADWLHALRPQDADAGAPH
jgi:Spy/CpxP family protein refolding chaperone